MRVKMYMDLSEEYWEFNKKCAEGRNNLSLSAGTSQSVKKMNGYDRIEIEVDLPDRYFKPDEADVFLEAKVKEA